MHRMIMGFIMSFLGIYVKCFGATVGFENFFQSHGFVFFFSSTCPYCQQFAPVLSRVASKLGARVLPLSFDEKPLPQYPMVYPASSGWVTSAYQNEPIDYPALFIAHPKTLQLYPVSRGFLTEEELLERLEVLLPRIMNYEVH